MYAGEPTGIHLKSAERHYKHCFRLCTQNWKATQLVEGMNVIYIKLRLVQSEAEWTLTTEHDLRITLYRIEVSNFTLVLFCNDLKGLSWTHFRTKDNLVLPNH